MSINPKVVGMLLVVILVAAVAAVAVVMIRDNAPPPKGVLGEVGSYQVTKPASDALRKDDRFLSQKQAVVALLDDKLAEDMGNDYNIQVSDADVTAAIQARVGTAKQEGPTYIQLTSKTNLINQKLVAALAGASNGQLVIAGFPKYIYIKGAGLLPDQQNLTPQDFARLYAQDKQQATAYIDNLHTEVSSGKISFQQAIDTERGNATYGIAAMSASPQSGSFNTAATGSIGAQLAMDHNFSSALAALQPGQVSKPFYITENNAMNGTGQQVDAYAAMIKLTARTSRITKYPNFAAMQKAYKKNLNYRVFQ